MSLDRLINILVTVALIEMMVTVGLRVTFAEVAATAKDLRAVARALVPNYLLVPAVAIALLLLFRANPLVATGFLVLAVCPGAPFGPSFTAIARGNVPVAVSLMVILAGSSAIASPVLLSVLLPWMTEGATVRVDPLGLVATLLITQLLPLLAGLLIRHRYPQLAARLQDPFEIVSKILNLSVAGLILVTQFSMLTEIKLTGFVGMLALLAGSLIIGWAAGGPERESRKTFA